MNKNLERLKKIKTGLHKQILKVYFPIYKRIKDRSIKRKRSGSEMEINLDILIPDRRHQYQEKIDKVKQIAIRMLECIDLIADQYDINYFLGYGTLIGAMRHKGFIPWDDDIDILMTQEEFDKFLEVSGNLPHCFRIFTMGYNFYKVMDPYSIISKDGKRGVAIDIFVMQNQSGKIVLRNVHNFKLLYFDHQDFYPSIEIPFEEYSFLVPRNSDKILTHIYGDYMKLPPEEERVNPHIGQKMEIKAYQR